jgi:hypothetical protein
MQRISCSALLSASAALPAVAAGSAPSPPAGYVDILRPPDLVTTHLLDGPVALSREGSRWVARRIAVTAEPQRRGLPVRIEAANQLLE